MQPIHVQTVRKSLGGILVHGNENFRIHHAVYYGRQEHRRTHTLLFINKSTEVDWGSLEKKAPSLVITDLAEEMIEKRSGITVVRVPSLVQAYWAFIDYYRGLFSIPVATVTGTCGKTTVKEMIRHMLEKDNKVAASESSKNEPRRSFPYLLQIDKKTDAAVFEHGLGNTGNIKHQCLIYKPTIGILTNIGVHHLDGCGNLQGYIRAKGEIVGGIAPGGTLILNADDENTKKVSLAPFKGKRIIRFGIHESCEFKGSDIRYTADGMAFSLIHEGRTYSAFVPGFGEHQVANALAALAAISEMGYSIEDGIMRLATFRNPERHLQVIRGVGGCTIIDDTWTINPTSIESALRVVGEIGKGKKVIFVVGDINRLGAYEKKYHQEVGELIASHQIDMLITVGSKAAEIARQAKTSGSMADIRMLPNADRVRELIAGKLDKDTIILIKGPMSSKGLIDVAKKLRE